MSRNEHKRVKHGHHPGDVSKAVKIAMRERRTPIVVREGHVISCEAAKVYRRMLIQKAKKRQRRRDQERVQEELEGLA